MGDDEFLRRFYLISFAHHIALGVICLEGNERLARVPTVMGHLMPGLVFTHLVCMVLALTSAPAWTLLPALVPFLFGAFRSTRSVLSFRALKRSEPHRHHLAATSWVLAANPDVPAWVADDEDSLKEGLGPWLEHELGVEGAEIARALAPDFSGTLADLLDASRSLATR